MAGFTPTFIDLIRHGEPEGGNVFRGRVDLKLTKLGMDQFRTRTMKHRQPWQHIISSPLQRCRVSAEQLAGEMDLSCRVSESWQEIFYGDWENVAVDEVFKKHAQQAQKMWQSPLEFCAPNGEPVAEFQQRIVSAWKELLNQYRGQHILVVNHGGVMRVLALHLLKLDPQAMNRLAIPYAGLIRFKIDHSEEQGKLKHWVSLLAMDGEEISREQADKVLSNV